MIMVTKKNEAFELAHLMLDKKEYFHNRFVSERAGYPVYTTDDGDSICDLESRLEVNFITGGSKNIWIQA